MALLGFESGGGRLKARIVVAAIAALLLAIFILAASGGSLSGRSEPVKPGATAIASAPKPPNVIDYQLVDSRLQQLMQDEAMVGLSVAIVENGDITFLKGYGETVAGSGDPVTPATVFRWASLSKGVAGDMVVKLAEEGKLSLYEPVGKYSYSLRLPAGNEHRATVSDLLSHRLGLFGHANDSKLEDGADPRMLRADLASLNSICPPSQCHAYQNVAYDAASEIVEKVTGRSYQEAVREELFLPLGMTSASMTREGLVTSRSWARPHVGGKNAKPVEVVDAYYRVPAAGGVNSSIKDLALWMRAQMGAEPEVLPGKVLANVQSPRAFTPGEQRRMRKFRERLTRSTYGLGWRVYTYADRKVVGHRGGVRGYRSMIMFDPVRKSGVAALWNSSTNQPGGLEFEVMDMLYKLPSKDWLGLDTAKGRAEPPPPTETLSEA